MVSASTRRPKGWLAKTRLYSMSLAVRIFSPEAELRVILNYAISFSPKQEGMD
jgi:hypothetical protein